LEREVVPFWREADARFGKVALEPTSSAYENLQLLQTVSSGRVRAFEVAVQGLRQHNSEVAKDAMQELARIDAQINERAAKANHARD
jgi:predicted transglutaminase-like cysteine proteinase